jgi:hypothetical protein
MFSARIAGAALCISLAAPAATAAATAPTCAAGGDNVLIQWSKPAAQGEHLRVYFRSSEEEVEHYMVMRSVDGGSTWAVLPKVAQQTPAIEYRVVSVGANGLNNLASGRIPVRAECGTPQLTGAAAEGSDGLIVGLTAEGNVVPKGFLCEGIVGKIEVDGEMRAHRGCRKAAPLAVAAGAVGAGALTAGITETQSPDVPQTNVEPISTARPQP